MFEISEREFFCKFAFSTSCQVRHNCEGLIFDLSIIVVEVIFLGSGKPHWIAREVPIYDDHEEQVWKVTVGSLTSADIAEALTHV
jgi:hypothetical protein